MSVMEIWLQASKGINVGDPLIHAYWKLWLKCYCACLEVAVHTLCQSDYSQKVKAKDFCFCRWSADFLKIWKRNTAANLYVNRFANSRNSNSKASDIVLFMDCADLSWLLYYIFIWRLIQIFPPFPPQGSSSWVPQEKERVCQMSGKPCGCVGKPKQDLDWRAKSTKGHLLPQSWVAVAVCGHGLKTVYKLLQQNKTKQKTKKEKKKKEEKTLEQKLLSSSFILCSLRPDLRQISEVS